MTNDYDAVIIGGGAAGLSAALMLTRAGRRTAIVDEGLPRNRFAREMHAVLGHDGKNPLDVVAAGRRDVEGFGGEFLRGTVDTARRHNGGFELTLGDGSALHARRIVVASGLVDRLPEIPGFAEQWGTGIASCPYCHGYEVAGRRIAVLAHGPQAVHYATLVRQWSENLVFLSNGGDLPGAEEGELLAARGIRAYSEPIERMISAEGTLTGIELAGGTVLPVDALFTHVRLEPNDAVLLALGATRAATPHGDFVPVDGFGATGIAGVWAVGNVVTPAANVPMSMGAGATAGAAANMSLVQEDNENALRRARAATDSGAELRS